MKKLLALFFIIPALVYTAAGQSISRADSLKLEQLAAKVFSCFSKPDFSVFKEIAAAELRCTICEGINGFRPISRKTFFDKYLPAVGSYAVWKRASQAKEKVFVRENKEYSDITIFFTSWKKDEYAAGHEGASLGLYFKREKGDFKFAGVETVP